MLVRAMVVYFMLISNAFAFGPCMSVKDMVRWLSLSFQEELVEITGTSNPDVDAHLFMSRGGKSWSIILIDNTGLACVAESGFNWGVGYEKA